MMEKRRRMLKVQSSSLIVEAFKTAEYIAGGGHESGISKGSADIDKTYLPNGQKYYLFGYCSDNFAVFTYYNGAITKIYEKFASSSVSLRDTGTSLSLTYGPYNANASSIGLAAFKFKYAVNNTFMNLNNEVITGLNVDGANYVTLLLSNFISEGETKYFFIGSYSNFCFYKAEGTTYSDLTAVFNHNLYLINYGDTSVRLSRSSSGYSGQYFYGYTVLSVKE